MRSRILAGLLGIALLATACSSGDSVFELQVGDCFDDEYVNGEIPSEISDVPLVDCSDLHDNEVYAVFEVNDASYPGQSALDATADEGCFVRFEPYVGRDYYESSLDFIYMTPTSDSWDEGDREVVCVLYAMDLSKLTGSMRSSGE